MSRTTFEIDTKSKFRRVRQAESTQQPQYERECERKKGHILRALDDGHIECECCDATWRFEGF
jgi:hypothetical protein